MGPLAQRPASAGIQLAPRVWGVVSVAAVLLACLAVYGPSFSAELLNFDDDRNFVQNPHFRAALPRALEWMARTAWMGHYQPLSWLSLAWDFAGSGDTGDFSRAAPRMHATNVALHALSAVGVLALARLLFQRLGLAQPRAAALLAALLFAVHPLRVESVAWVTERRDVLSAPFFLGSLLAYLALFAKGPAGGVRSQAALLSSGVFALCAAVLAVRALDLTRPGTLGFAPHGPLKLQLALGLLCVSTWLALRGMERTAARAGWFSLCLILMLLSLLAKAWAVVLPAVFLVLDVGVLGRGRGTPRPRQWLALVLEKAPFFALAAVFLALASWAQASQIATWKSLAEHTWTERALQACYGLWYYARKCVWPSGLAPIHELPGELRLLDPRFGLCALGVGLVLVALVLRRARAHLVAVAAVSYAVIVSPVLGLAQSGPQLVADRYAYLATIPLLILLAGGFMRLVGTKAWAPGLAAAWILALGALTFAQAKVWRTSQSLWEYSVVAKPDSPTAHLSLGTLLEEQARQAQTEARLALLARAQSHLARALELGLQARAYSGLAAVAAQRAALDPQGAAEQRQKAVEFSRRAIAAGASEKALLPEFQLNLGVHLYQAGQREEGLLQVERFLSARPDSVFGLRTAAVMLLDLARPGRALELCEQWLELTPKDPQATRLKAQALADLGRGQQPQ